MFSPRREVLAWMPKNHFAESDAFVKNLRPISHLMRLWGVFALTVQFQFKLVSLSWLWTLSVMCILIGCHFIEKIDNLNSLKKPLYIGRTLLVSITTLCNDYNLPDLIYSFERFDREYFRIYGIHEKMQRIHKGWTWFGINILSMLLLIVDFFDHDEVIFARYISYMARQMSIYLYVFFCLHLIFRFRNLQKKWRGKNYYYAEMYLEQSRLLYQDLCSLVCKLSQCYGYKLTVFILTMCLTILLDIYEYLYIKNQIQINHAVGTLFDILNIVLICIVSGKVISEIALSMTTYIIVVVQYSSELTQIIDKEKRR